MPSHSSASVVHQHIHHLQFIIASTSSNHHRIITLNSTSSTQNNSQIYILFNYFTSWHLKQTNITLNTNRYHLQRKTKIKHHIHMHHMFFSIFIIFIYEIMDFIYKNPIHRCLKQLLFWLKIVRVHCRQTQLFYCTLFKPKKTLFQASFLSWWSGRDSNPWPTA